MLTRTELISSLLNKLEQENLDWLLWLDKKIKNENLIAILTANKCQSWLEFYPEGLRELQAEVLVHSPQHQFGFYILIAQIFRKDCKLDTWPHWLFGSNTTLERKKEGFEEVARSIGKTYQFCYRAYIKSMRVLITNYEFNTIKFACEKQGFNLIANSKEELLFNKDSSLYEKLENIFIKAHLLLTPWKDSVYSKGIKNLGLRMFDANNPILNYYQTLNNGRAKDFFEVILQSSEIKSPEAYLDFRDEKGSRTEYKWF